MMETLDGSPYPVVPSDKLGTASLKPSAVTGSVTVPKGRRRPPSPEEQARRKLWGRRWGAVNSHLAQRMREEDV